MTAMDSSLNACSASCCCGHQWHIRSSSTSAAVVKVPSGKVPMLPVVHASAHVLLMPGS